MTTLVKTYKHADFILTNYTKTVCTLLCVCIGIFLSAYLAFLGHTIFSVVERKSVDTKSQALAVQANQLEIQYLNDTNTLNLAYVQSLGFKEPTTVSFSTRKEDLVSMAR